MANRETFVKLRVVEIHSRGAPPMSRIVGVNNLLARNIKQKEGDLAPPRAGIRRYPTDDSFHSKCPGSQDPGHF